MSRVCRRLCPAHSQILTKPLILFVEGWVPEGQFFNRNSIVQTIALQTLQAHLEATNRCHLASHMLPSHQGYRGDLNNISYLRTDTTCLSADG